MEEAVSAFPRLTPAGRQVEELLATEGYENTAFNVYMLNLGDGIAMTAGDWPEWHRRMARELRLDEAEIMPEDEYGEHTEPIIDRRPVRDVDGRTIGFEDVVNPRYYGGT
jgi:hypothetical protein